MPKLAQPLSGYVRLVNVTPRGSILQIFVNPATAFLSTKRIKQKSMSVGYWYRKNTPVGPTLVGPVALNDPKKKDPIKSPMLPTTWRAFWRRAGLTVTPAIVRYKYVEGPKESYIREMMTEGW